MHDLHPKWLDQVLGGALFTALAVALVATFLRVFAPPIVIPAAPPYTKYDRAAMQAAVTPAAVAAEQDQVLSFGSRFLGQDGYYRTEQYLRERFTKAGLQLCEQDLSSVAPKTQTAQLLDAQQAPLPVAIYPFMPNHLQPMNTPPAGLSGKLLLLTDEVMSSATTFSDAIGVIDLAHPAPKNFGTDWTRYAQLGLRALIVTDSEGLGKLPWDSLGPMVANLPVNYVRLAAEPAILPLLGQTVTLKVRTAYAATPHRNLLGVLKGGKAHGEALVITAAYDAGSVLPDLAPGAGQALPVALMLKLLDGLLPYQAELQRDVIFVAIGNHAMGQDSLNRLLTATGRYHDPRGRREELAGELAEHATAAAQLQTLLKAGEAPAFATDPAATTKQLDQWDATTRALFNDQCQYVLNSLVFEHAEPVLQTRMAFRRLPTPDEQSPEFHAYQLAKRAYDHIFSAAGYPLPKLLAERPEMATEGGLRTRLLARLTTLRDFHLQEQTRRKQELALFDLFASYQTVLVVAPEILPTKAPAPPPPVVAATGSTATATVAAGIPAPVAPVVTLADGPVLPKESLSFTMGGNGVDQSGPQGATMQWLLGSAIQELKLTKEVTFSFAPANQGNAMSDQTRAVPLQAHLWSAFSYPAYSLVSPGNAYNYLYWPVTLPEMRQLDTVHRSLRLVGEVALMAAFGNGRGVPLPTQPAIHHFHGAVYVAGVGQSIIPNYPLVGALIGNQMSYSTNNRGFYPYVILQTDPEGRYRYPYCMTSFFDTNDYSPDAVAYDANGLISYMKDQGNSAQSVYKSMHLGQDAMDGTVNLVAFRASAVTLLDLVNPQTLKAFGGVDFIRSQGLAGFDRSNAYREGDRGVTAFLPTDESFYVKLSAGSVNNPLVQQTRAFILGTPPAQVQHPEPVDHLGGEISGTGFPVATTPLLLNVPRETALSMADVNGKRLAVENHGGTRMADERTESFHRRSVELLDEAAQPSLPVKQALLKARDAVTYNILNQPILRQNIYEAVLGICWYLLLLVPFAFFFEKLLFGFTDIRKQIAASTVIFLTVFILLRVLHPAFAMISSSIMILLGFIIMLISIGITLLFAAKFTENLSEMRKRRGQVDAAEVNTMGVIGTAFLLGLNNMHRRRVRTGLTCATLVLLTFVMICFTSVQSDLVDSQVATGKAPYQGLLVIGENSTPIDDATLGALQTKYGATAKVVPRRFLTGYEEWGTRERSNPQIEVVYTAPAGTKKSARFASIVQLGAEDPLAQQVQVTTGVPWFSKEQETATSGPVPIYLPQAAAELLGLAVADFAAGPVKVKLNGEECLVQGLFNGGSLDAVRDLDNFTIMPFDVAALRTVTAGPGQNVLLAEPTDPRLGGDHVILASQRNVSASIGKSKARIYSVGVVLPPALPYKEAKQVIDDYLEQSGASTYYGLGGYSFIGQRARTRSFAGVLEMLIPLIIAALTVLNTMRGSVYERKDEIFVYNAVGIAPKFIAFMFLAEAFVYAVVGSVLGYLLSQGTGRILTELHLTGGLNMTFTSFTTIYASITIALSVFASTLFPMYVAYRIAAPAEDSGWHLPPPTGDELRFRLPFTFDHADRLAILAFFHRYFVDHGEGSSGAFFAGKPIIGVAERGDPLAPGALTPELRVPIWLKPFDLGVSQDLAISLVVDHETKEFIAELTLSRKSGTLDNWTRLNVHFVRHLRRHFLHWRAVSAEDRQAMFIEAKDLLTATVNAAGSAHG